MNSIMSIVRGISLSKAENSSDPPSDEGNKSDTKLLSVAWNQDWSGFMVGTERGFNVYSCNPIKEEFKRNTLIKSGFKIGEMLFLSNLFALVGNGYDISKYPRNKVVIWDDLKKCINCELNFNSEVIAVKLMREYIIVVLKQRIYVYSLENLMVRLKVETIRNPRGICCVSHSETNAFLACPGFHPGQVHIHDLKKNIIPGFTRINAHDNDGITRIKAHDNDIACMSLTIDGSLLATASTKGTLIRIFNALDGTLLQELRRGIERALIYSIAISSNLRWVAASSDKGTLHVFRLRPNILSVSSNDIDPASSLTYIKGILPKYLYDNDRSFAQFSLPISTKFIVCFGSEDTVLVVGIDGSYRRCKFDEEGGQMVELEHKCFLSLPEEETGDTMVVI